MTIQQAIDHLKEEQPISMRTSEALRVLLAEYEVLFKTVEQLGPRLLTEMQEAADWEAIAIRQQRLLKDRKKPGVDAVIEEFLLQLEAKTKTQHENTDRPQS